MVAKGCVPNVISYAALIHGLCKEGRLQEADKVLEEMSEKDVVPNVVTYNTLIHALCTKL